MGLLSRCGVTSATARYYCAVDSASFVIWKSRLLEDCWIVEVVDSYLCFEWGVIPRYLLTLSRGRVGNESYSLFRGWPGAEKELLLAGATP